MKKPTFFVEVYIHSSFDGLPEEKKGILEEQVRITEEWFEKYTPLDVRFVITPFSDTLDLRFLFTNFNNQFGPHFWGIKAIDILRKYVKPNYYHAVAVLYNLQGIEEWQSTLTKGSVQNYAWIEPKDWVNGAPSIELSFSPYNLDDCSRKMTHELIHIAHALAKKAGIVTKDTMDWYDDENELNLTKAPNGNRARNLRELEAHWDKIAEVPQSRGIIAWVIELLKSFGVKPEESFGPDYAEEFPEPTAPPVLVAESTPVKSKRKRLQLWAEAVQKHEGWFAGSRSQRNNNPGNLRYTPYTKSLGAVGQDEGRFCEFPDYGTGWSALVQFLTDAANNLLIPYKGNPTLLEFFSVYAPSSDNNNPRRYAEVVAGYIGTGVTVDTTISSLLL